MLLYHVMFGILLFLPPAAKWNAQTVNWSSSARLAVGDWGFNRPGYPTGLYIHGVTVKTGESIPNPVIYDNDVFDDVFDDEVAFALASLGEMKLAGLIVTPVLTDGWGFSQPAWKKTAFDARNRAGASGMRMDLIPPITIGTEAESERAAERKDSAGARLYIKLINEQFNRDPAHPLLVNVGGQAATLASAYTIDPSIAEKCIVYYTDLRVYNGHYRWASETVAQHFRVVSWGDDAWWIAKRCQNDWRVLPRPEHCQGNENRSESGEWARLTAMHTAILDHMVEQFQTRGEYCMGEKKADAYADGTFLHAWLPAIFNTVELKEVRGGNVLHVTSFRPNNEHLVKEFTLRVLLDPNAYPRR
jgi:hypothetical protein